MQSRCLIGTPEHLRVQESLILTARRLLLSCAPRGATYAVRTLTKQVVLGF